MEWLEKMMFPLQGRVPGLASRFRFRKTGLVNLHQDVEACEYQDVHIMWEMLKKTETELGSRPNKTNRPIWNVFRWTRISPCLGTPIAMSENAPA